MTEIYYKHGADSGNFVIGTWGDLVRGDGFIKLLYDDLARKGDTHGGGSEVALTISTGLDNWELIKDTPPPPPEDGAIR